MPRVIEDNIDGEVLSAATDDELVAVVVKHYQDRHPEADMDEEMARAMVEREAYDASDA